MKWIILSATIVIVIGVGLIYMNNFKNNVCKTFEDYYSNRDNNKNCYYNPDYHLTVPHIIERYGYPVETHTVTTNDGYILTMFRIPPKNETIGLNRRKTVFLQHGMGANSGGFLCIGKRSLVFLLANQGHDVWLGNFRGTMYSLNHTHLSSADSKYWDFSFHEHGIYDLPTQLGLINEVTKEKITYIGHSMGATALYVYQAAYPKDSSEKIDLFINLAPAVFLNETKTSAKYGFPLWLLIEPILRTLTNGRIHAKQISTNAELFNKICLPFKFQLKLCTIVENVLFGFDYEQWEPETLPICILKIPDYTSVKSMTHFLQLTQSDSFRNYDYGISENKKIYGSPEPPSYDLSKVKIPNYFIRGDNDLMVSKENVEILYNSLPKIATPHDIFVVENENFNHHDFVLAKDVVPLLYDHIINLLNS